MVLVKPKVADVFMLDLEKKQDKVSATEFATTLGKYFADEKYDIPEIVTAINYALFKISKTAKDYVMNILDALIRLYPKIHARYTFELVDRTNY